MLVTPFLYFEGFTYRMRSSLNGSPPLLGLGIMSDLLCQRTNEPYTTLPLLGEQTPHRA